MEKKEETMTKSLDVLVVDDREENRQAARQYFSTRPGVKLDFAMTYEEGLQKIRGGQYNVGIFDLELPRTEGAEPEKLGFELAREATKYSLLPWAVMTAGIDHHRCQAAFVSYCWDGIKDPNSRLKEITEIPKTDPRAWQTVYERLTASEMLIGAMDRYHRFIGKPISPELTRLFVPGYEER